ncbi:hypothetical protein HZH68_016742 [Vespula germanica]|uniref:Thiamine transporter SLC35F3 n=1 Tax=Vespula germanica TaxID=30212 RepID=A0A834J0V4_VESGE|nr:hypothetical protein HZH68_016742 [Vespula germanica]
MGSGSVGEVPTIFHPRRSRAPSIVLSEDQQNHGPIASPIQVVLDSTGCEQQQGCSVAGGCGDSASSCRSLETSGSGVGSGTGGTGIATGSTGGPGGGGGGQGHGSLSQTQSTCNVTTPSVAYQQSRPNKLSACYASCCAESAKKTVLPYNAPFFTTWFCTNWEVLYFPVYFICRAVRTKCTTPSEILAESLRGFRDKGFTGGRFLVKCSLFCGLWVVTNYMYIYSLRILLATDVMALFATNVSCVYLLSWVILHEQFVGVRIVAVILCNTGIALLAYMDGITGSPTLGGVVLATTAAAGSAVYKVVFKKVIGETTFGQMSLFFSLIGLCNAALLWPICLALYFSGAESVHWTRLPWAALLSASILHLVANMLGNFSIALTYDLFITLGLITAVPVSAALMHD